MVIATIDPTPPIRKQVITNILVIIFELNYAGMKRIIANSPSMSTLFWLITTTDLIYI